MNWVIYSLNGCQLFVYFGSEKALSLVQAIKII
jgi:hypothetical protein